MGRCFNEIPQFRLNTEIESHYLCPLHPKRFRRFQRPHWLRLPLDVSVSSFILASA